MATRNIIPRADGEGQVGLAAQAWGKVYADEIYEGGVRVQTGESADDKTVKASSTDETPGYLDAKVDGTTLEVSGDKLAVKSTFLATTSAAGLMSAADKVRLDALELKALTIASIESY